LQKNLSLKLSCIRNSFQHNFIYAWFTTAVKQPAPETRKFPSRRGQTCFVKAGKYKIEIWSLGDFNSAARKAAFAFE